MRTQYKFIYLLLFLIMFSAFAQTKELSSTKPEKVGISTERLTRLDTTFQAYVDNEDMAGSVILAARNGKIFYHKAFGFRDRESKAPMKADTMFRIASQTKAIVSVAAMMLQEQGLIDINEPVGKYLPEFMETTVANPLDNGGFTIEKAKRPITIHDLLTHTSGVGYGHGIAKSLWRGAGIQGWYFADRNEKMSEIVKRMAKLPFDAQPGEIWNYGYSTDILGVVLEVASGQSLDELLDTLIFKPLKMKDTHFYIPKSKSKRLAVVYTPKANGGIKRSPKRGTMNAQGHYVKGPRKAFSAGAGLVSTAEDYAIFLQMLLNGGHYDKARLLSRKSVELMTTDHLGSIPYREGSGFGLGFRVITNLGLNAELGSVGTYRWGGAYHSNYWVDPKEDLLVVYFTQLRPDTPINDHRKLRSLIYQSIVD